MLAEKENPLNPPPPHCSADADLYCLECGYNLRGLSGDPRRCPECGHLNDVLSVVFFKAQLRKLERPAVLSFAFGICGLPCLALQVQLLATRGPGGFAGSFAGSTLILLGVWALGLLRFRKACEARRGWAVVLLCYYCYNLFRAVLLIGVLATGVLIAARRVEWIPVPIGVCLGFVWAQPRLRKKMKILLHRMAVEIALQHMPATLLPSRDASEPIVGELL